MAYIFLHLAGREAIRKEKMILLAIQPLYIVQIALFDSWQNLVKVSLFSKKNCLKL